MAEKQPYLKERNPPRNVDVYMADDVQHLFADGGARILMGAEVTKVELTHSFGAMVEGGPDQRETFAILAMPTAAVVEMCASILEQHAKNAKLVRAGTDVVGNALREAIKRVAAIKL
jgi:hypothetical protein